MRARRTRLPSRAGPGGPGRRRTGGGTPAREAGVAGARPVADEDGGAAARVRQARERAREAAGSARERARERLADAGEAVRSRRLDMPWARSLPARLTRALVQRGLLLPALSF